VDKQELRRKIAEALGWRFETKPVPVFAGGDLDRPTGEKRTIWRWIHDDHLGTQWMLENYFPNWPDSVEDALALCLELVPDAWACVQPWGPKREQFIATFLVTGFKTERPIYEGVMGDTPAEALARLAYAALQGVRDE
jgi:hypothetical protein